MDGGRAPLLILGTKTFPEEVAELAEESGFVVDGFVENLDRDRAGGSILGRPIHWIDDIGRFRDSHQVVAGLGTTTRKRFIEETAALGMSFATVVHPSARIPSSTTLGIGTVVNVGVIVAAQCAIGNHVLLNRGTLVGHHTSIADYVSVMPGANVAGVCSIAESVYVGMGAIVIDHISIGSGTVVAAGAVVTKDLAESVLAAGVPARIVKTDIDNK